MGTPDFAVSTLEALLLAPEHEVVAVVTQPDRPRGRGQKLLMTPVKEFAVNHALRVLQPPKVKNEEFIKELTALAPDLIVVVAFGQILPSSILKLPRFGCINVHASLLPKYRGAAPIHYALLAGEKESGVTTMLMDEGMDTGDMLLKKAVPLSLETTMGELHDELKIIGASLLLETIARLEAGKITPEKQNHEEATYASLLDKAIEKIDWEQSATTIHNKIRGLNPWPGAYTTQPNGHKLKVWRSRVLNEEKTNQQPGTITALTADGFVVACGTGLLVLLEVQPESKKMMSAAVYCNGYQIKTGMLLGEAQK